MKNFIRIFTLLLMYLVSINLAAQNPAMVKDIWDGSGDGKPFFLRELNDILYFNAYDETNGVQFWRSDGTGSGTYVVKNISTGCLYNIDSYLYFSGNDGLKGAEPWKSNGTAAGTVIIKDIVKGKTGSNPSYWAKSGSTVFFNPLLNSEWQLWKTNGTDAGTAIVKTINKKGNDAVCLLHDVNGTLFFWADNGSTGQELWKSTGTDAGTVLIKDICPGSGTSLVTQFPNPYSNYKDMAGQSSAVNANGIFYFLAYEPVYGQELWKSNGTASGTVRVTDINANSGNSTPTMLTVMGDYLYFTATDGSSGVELWKIHLVNGTVTMVADINPNGDSYPMQLTVVNSALYFSANDGTNGRELWKYDGVNPPAAVTELNGTSDGVEGEVAFKFQEPWTDHWCLPNDNGIVYFEGTNGTDGWELWMYDTQTGSYSQVADINPGSADAYLSWAEFAGGKLFFTATDGANGRELWVFDPSSPRKGFFEAEEAGVKDNFKIAVYPNPADDNIVVSGSFSDKTNVEVRLFDILGAVLLSLNLSGVSGLNESMSLSGLAPGVYIVELRIGSHSVQKKIVKR